MTDFLNIIFYNIPSTTSMPELIEIYANIFSSILTGVVAILGLGYLKPLKDKTLSATFTFWSQLSVRLMVVQKWMKLDPSVLNNMYSPEARMGLTALTSDEDRIKGFKNAIQSTIDYIESAEDQMPAYRGWSGDYTKLISYLGDMLVYDVCDSEHYFKFSTHATDEDRNEYCKEICETIDKICTEIEKRQKKVEKRIV